MVNPNAALGAHISMTSLLYSCDKNKKELLPELTEAIQNFFQEATGKINVQIVGGQKSLDTDGTLKYIYPKDSDKWSFGQIIKDYITKLFRKYKNYNLDDSLLNYFEGSGYGDKEN